MSQAFNIDRGNINCAVQKVLLSPLLWPRLQSNWTPTFVLRHFQNRSPPGEIVTNSLLSSAPTATASSRSRNWLTSVNNRSSPLPIFCHKLDSSGVNDPICPSASDNRRSKVVSNKGQYFVHYIFPQKVKSLTSQIHSKSRLSQWEMSAIAQRHLVWGRVYHLPTLGEVNKGITKSNIRLRPLFLLLQLWGASTPLFFTRQQGVSHFPLQASWMHFLIFQLESGFGVILWIFPHWDTHLLLSSAVVIPDDSWSPIFLSHIG